MTASSIGTYLDIMSTTSSKQSEVPESAAPPQDIAAVAQVLTLVMAGKGTVEEIVQATGLDANQALAALVSLANAGVVELSTNGAEVRATPSESIAAIADG